MLVLSVENVRKTYGLKPLLDGVTFSVEAGEKVGVLGRNGAGKSTLLKIIAGQETADVGAVIVPNNGRVAYLPQAPTFTAGLSVLDALFENASDELRLLHDYEAAVHALEASGGTDASLLHRVAELAHRMDTTGGWDREAEAKALLGKLGVDDPFAAIETLSGGQRKRVALARALLLRPDLLLLDEPTNHLDADTVEWLEAALASFPGALLVVTHDRYFLERVTRVMLELDRGRAQRYEGTYSDYLEAKAVEAEQAEASEARRQNLARRELAWLRRGAKARSTKQKARVERAEALQQRSDDGPDASVQMASVATRLGNRVVELDGVTKSYDGQTVLDDLTLSLVRGSRIGVLGPNGAGKTTLLDLVAGTIAPDRGTMEIGQTAKIGYYDQESRALRDDQRMLDYVKEAAENVRLPDGSVITAGQMLERFLFPSGQHGQPVGLLSGGERRRLYLLRVLMTAPNVLLLDEPTNDLDLATLAALEDYLETFPGAVVAVSHDRAFLDRVAEHTLVFTGGGQTRLHPGGYSAWKETESAELQAANHERRNRGESAAKPAALSPKPEASGSAPPSKLSYHERRELDALEARIPEAEARKAALEADLAEQASDYAAVQRLSAELATLSAALDTDVERWAELAERA